MVTERRFILAETYIIKEGDLSTKLDPDIRWEALEYNPYKKVFVPASSASSREELIHRLDRDFNGGTKEDKIKQKIRDLDPDILKDYLSRLEKLENAAKKDDIPGPGIIGEVRVENLVLTSESTNEPTQVEDKKTKPKKTSGD